MNLCSDCRASAHPPTHPPTHTLTHPRCHMEHLGVSLAGNSGLERATSDTSVGRRPIPSRVRVAPCEGARW